MILDGCDTFYQLDRFCHRPRPELERRARAEEHGRDSESVIVLAERALPEPWKRGSSREAVRARFEIRTVLDPRERA